MAQTNLNEPALKRALKAALVETLQEQRDLLRDVFTEVLEDFALTEAIHDGQKTKELIVRTCSTFCTASHEGAKPRRI